MIRKKRQLIGVFAIMFVILLSISIAYAALSRTLNVTTNKITQQGLTWNIGFKTGTVTCAVVTDNSGATSCGTATATSNTISGISTSLSGVGDKCSCTFSILNNGTLAGKISAINITSPTGESCTKTGSTMVCGNITYKLHYDTASSTSLVTENDIITAKTGSTATEKVVVLTMEYSGSTASEVDFSQSGFQYNLVFTQY